MRALLGSTSRIEVAVVVVDDTGAGTLHLDGQVAGHVVAARPSAVVQVLLDYAATVGRDLAVVTRHTDGRGAIHELHPSGTATLLRQPSTVPQPTRLHSPERRPRAMSRCGRKVRAATSQGWSAVVSTWAVSRQWLVSHGLWLMLCAEILALVGSLTFIVVALAPYLWPRP